MDNTRGNNIHRRRQLPVLTDDLFSSARFTGQTIPVVPINGVVTDDQIPPNGRTSPTRRVTFTGHTTPINRSIPTGRSAPTSRITPSGRTIHPGLTTLTNNSLSISSVVRMRPTFSAGSGVPTNRSAPSSRTTPTNRVICTGSTTPAGLTTPISSTVPVSSSVQIRPTVFAGSDVPANCNAPTRCTTPTDRAIFTSHTTPTSCTMPITSVVRMRPTVSVGSDVPASRNAPTGSGAHNRPLVGTRSAVQTRPSVSTGSAVPANPTLPSSIVNTGRAAQAHPGRAPNPSLLEFQAEHRSQRVIEGEYLEPLFTRRHIMYLPWDPRYENYVIAAGLYGVHKIGHIPTDHALISALVERWRQETHTFHFPVGEMTVTLQDVSVLLGLRIDGEAICLRTDHDWSKVVSTLLRRVDETTFRKKSKVAINISWLLQHFSACPLDADPITVKKFARAYCFFLVGSVLFTDHSGDSISAIYLLLFRDFERAGRYSWASGVLAYLYKELCLATKPKRKQFGGSVMLLQLWSWERLPMGRPTARRNVQLPQLGGEDLARRPPLGYGWSFEKKYADHVTCRVMESYRRELDGLIDSKVTWLPYEDRMLVLPANCREEDKKLWRTTAPLIHFWIIEMYNPGRVARQFNLNQTIPPLFRDTDEDLHALINGIGDKWPHVHARHLQKWHIRRHLCLRDQTPYDYVNHERYMRWFSRATILYLSSPGGVPNTDSSARRVTQIAMSIVERFRDVADEDSRAFARELLHSCRSAIEAVHEPVSNNNIFTAFDGEQPRWRVVSPVPDGDPGPSNRAPAKRARRSASASH